MKRNLLFALILAAAMALGSTAMADDGDGEERARFYDFENMLIDGEFRSPDLMLMEGQGRAQFDRLLNLRTSFIPKIEESTEERSLR
jgi:hypothetical protein